MPSPKDNTVRSHKDAPLYGPLYIIVGPTASGKSGLALDLARHLNGVVINADSMQIYGALSLVTARPSGEDLTKAPHCLYGFIKNPNEPYSVAKWRQAALREIQQAFRLGKTPVLVGGTGLYIKALLEGLADIPESTPLLKEQLRLQAQSPGGPQDLYERLQKKDPVAAEQLNASDTQRIIRALEVVLTTGKPLHEWHAQPVSPLPYQTKIIFVNPPREDVVARAYKRLQTMFKDGAVDEVKGLLEVGLESNSPLRKAVGVREIEAFLQGELTVEEAIEKSFIATRQYIKRQQTWFKRQIVPDFILPKCYEALDFSGFLSDNFNQL